MNYDTLLTFGIINEVVQFLKEKKNSKDPSICDDIDFEHLVQVYYNEVTKQETFRVQFNYHLVMEINRNKEKTLPFGIVIFKIITPFEGDPISRKRSNRDDLLTVINEMFDDITF